MASPGAGGTAGNRTQVTCSKCGKETSVPFTPTPGRPVYCHACFSSQGPARAPAGGRSFGGSARVPPVGRSTPRQRMMAQGRKGHFMYDARAILTRMEGGMDDQHIRAFLEGLFARGARTSTEAAQEFLDSKLEDKTITPDQRDAMGQLVERYSFWR